MIIQCIFSCNTSICGKEYEIAFQPNYLKYIEDISVVSFRDGTRYIYPSQLVFSTIIDSTIQYIGCLKSSFKSTAYEIVCTT